MMMVVNCSFVVHEDDGVFDMEGWVVVLSLELRLNLSWKHEVVVKMIVLLFKLLYLV